MANTNTTHPIKPVTITLAATPQNVATDLGLDNTTLAKDTQCQWFAIQNKHASASLYIQETLAAAAADSIEIKPGDYYRANQLPTGTYDLREYWVRAGIDALKYVIERKRL